MYLQQVMSSVFTYQTLILSRQFDRPLFGWTLIYLCLDKVGRV